MRVAAVLLLAGCGRMFFDPRDDAGTTRYAHSTLTLAAPATALGDFPLPVFLDDSRAARDKIRDGADLRFLDASGTVLPYEIEQLGAPGGKPLIAWVRVPTIVGTTTTIEVRYGGDTGPAATDAVWTSDFAAVFHFASDGTALDSTANHRDAMPSGTHAADSVIGSGRDLDGPQSEYLLVPGGSTFAASEQTVSAWLWPRVVASGYVAVVSRQYGIAGDNDIYLGLVGSQAVTTCENATQEWDAAGGAVTAQQAVYLTGVANGTQETIYLDGQAVAEIPVTGPLVDSTHPIFIGADRSTNTGSDSDPCCDFVDGVVDELRLQSTARTPAWIAYDNLAQRDQVITYGPVTSGP